MKVCLWGGVRSCSMVTDGGSDVTRLTDAYRNRLAKATEGPIEVTSFIR